MRVQIQHPGLALSDDFRQLLRRRLRRTLGPFQRAILRIRLWISDDGDSRGGLEKICLIEARLTPSGQLWSRGADMNATLAAGKAIDDLAKRLSRYKACTLARSRRGNVVHHEGAKQ